MQIKLRFLGGAQNVTGSRHMLEVNGTRLLVDCGLYQERQFKARNWEPFQVPPASIDAVLWFVIGAARYSFATHDREFATKMIENM